MNITICGSIAFYDNMLEIKRKLEENGHKVKLPPIEVEDKNHKKISVKEYYLIRKKETKNKSWIWDRKKEAMEMHFKKIKLSDAILVLNYDKNNIKNYIGGNTLIEMGIAFYLNKKIFLLNKVPEINYKEEVLGMKPIILNKKIERIK